MADSIGHGHRSPLIKIKESRAASISQIAGLLRRKIHASIVHPETV
ncbi:hypothetical protein [Bradyrhizobium ivorense]|nr:hypothetical protein [Bradyrhizobium ivorense]